MALDKLVGRLASGNRTLASKVISVILTIVMTFMSWSPAAFMAVVDGGLNDASVGEVEPGNDTVVNGTVQLVLENSTAANENVAVLTAPAAAPADDVAGDATSPEPGDGLDPAAPVSADDGEGNGTEPGDEPSVEPGNGTEPGEGLEPGDGTEPAGDEPNATETGNVTEPGDDVDPNAIAPDEAEPSVSSEPTPDLAETMPAATFRAWSNNIYVGVDAPVGAFPAGTRMVVKPVAASQIYDAVNEAVSGKVEQENILAIDITFLCAIDGVEQEIEPALPIKVFLQTDAVTPRSDAKVVHVDDENKATVVDASANISAKRMNFESDEFSIYAIVTTGDDARLLVKFIGLNNEVIDAMYVKKGDDMEQVLYDPGAGTIPEDIYFRGWTTEANYTPSTTPALTIQNIREIYEDDSAFNGITDGQEVVYYAMLFKAYRVTYLDENNV
ncbi:MAG: hypothetical protein IJJ14_07405, partial [Coriobacteriales bacterium]|nr:hypothetical protein [Coriobacteriales bacterium]